MKTLLFFSLLLLTIVGKGQSSNYMVLDYQHKRSRVIYGYEIDYTYSVVKGLGKKKDSLLNALVKQHGRLEEVESGFEEILREQQNSLDTTSHSISHYDCNIIIEIICEDLAIITVSGYEYNSGAAHGGTFDYVLNVDLNTFSILEPEDLFVDQDNAIHYFTEQINQRLSSSDNKEIHLLKEDDFYEYLNQFELGKDQITFSLSENGVFPYLEWGKEAFQLDEIQSLMKWKNPCSKD